MTASCISKCRASSMREENQLGMNNCMDRCIVKFDETRKVVEKELSREIEQL